jgi:hypothetical protein
MTMRSLLSALLTAALVLTALNVLIGVWSHKLPYYQKLELIRNSHEPDLLFLGNSLLDQHLDENAFVEAAQRAQFRPLNAALAATQSPEQQLLFEYAVRSHAGIRTLVVGILDSQLTGEDHSRVVDLIGNRMVGVDPRFPVPEVQGVYGFSALDCAEIEALRAFPMAANRANAWRQVELLRRSMESIGMPQTAANSMGRADDFAEAMEFAQIDTLDAQARSFLNHRDRFNASYESIFSQARRTEMKVVIVVMPISPAHRALFYDRPLWRQYFAALEDLAFRRGIQFIDASQWMLLQQDFSDHLHMTPLTAHNFSVRLGAELARAVIQ